MRDYAKIKTEEPFNWKEAIIGALILPGVFGFVLILQVII